MYAITVRPTDKTDAKGRHRPGPENMEWAQVPIPTPASGEVRVAVKAVGMNRADLLQRQGLYPPPPGVSETMGLEVCGTIDALGDDVDGWQMGDEVVALLAGGGYAEQVIVPAGQLLHMPDGVEPAVASTLVEVAATVISNMDHVHLHEGETILVHGGAGGIGQFAIQYAKARGCRVIVTAGTQEKRDFCRELGADVAIDYHEDWVAAVKEATDGAGVDVILDIMGAKYLDANVDSLAMDGRLVIIGMQGGVKGELRIDKVLNKRATVTATSLRFRDLADKARICRLVEEQAWPMYASGQIKPAPVETFALPDAADAHRRLESGEVLGKIALTL